VHLLIVVVGLGLDVNLCRTDCCGFAVDFRFVVDFVIQLVFDATMDFVCAITMTMTPQPVVAGAEPSPGNYLRDIGDV